MHAAKGGDLPHWNGDVDTGSPPVIEHCNGDPVCVFDAIVAATPAGVSVTAIVWENGKDKARVTAHGPGAQKFLEETLAAKGVVELLSRLERKNQRG